MTRNKNIQLTLSRMAELLRSTNTIDWAMSLEKLCIEIDNASDFPMGSILGLFGGMGSLNDLVLYRHGVLLVKENDEFDILRSRLYELCHEKKI